ncbi:MAG: cysteine sulfinate desulfinase [Gammaproteobacteria bacterium RIFCSPHIGHO2_12_FULL_37_14]|nr:MAG: cysteine sulfinate desulfinase [Gammaproteobacteria bacterium RIFCSPHIGHO2_12_FULL_37_14]
MNVAINHPIYLNLSRDFPALQQQNRGKPMTYLDSASSSQKPRQVIEAMSQFYMNDYANIHRGIYELSERSTQLYENARQQVKKFINAAHADEIVFVHSTTDAINLIAQSYGRSRWQAGDEVILSEMEHHSNIVPWYLLKQQIGLVIKVIPVTDSGELDINVYQQLFSSRTKLVALAHASNVMGTINPVKKMVEVAHAHAVPVLLDGAQAIAHTVVDVQDINCDFYVFSAHKLYGPTGVGVLYGKNTLLAAMPPYQGGGGMIETVSFSKISFATCPQKFEAGTPNIAGAIGLNAAIQYIHEIGITNIYSHDQALLNYAEKKFAEISGLRTIGTAHPKIGVISFVLDGIHPHDVGTVLDHEGIAVRAGHHCAMPLMERFNIPATVRISFGVYNTEQEIDVAIQAIHLTKRLLG